MYARAQSFTENTILQGWKKCGIRELEGMKVFNEADFAPSRNTSTRAEVPHSFQNELPSDYNPWPGTEPLPEVNETVDEGVPTYPDFVRLWEDGSSSNEDEGSDKEDEEED